MNTIAMKEFTLFQGLSDDEIAEFNGVTREIKITAGKNFITEGEIGDSIFLLLDGEVEVNQALTLPMGKGSVDNREKAIIKLSSEFRPMFGEMSLFHDEDRRSAKYWKVTYFESAAGIRKPAIR